MKCVFIADTGTGDENQRAVGRGLSKLVRDNDIKFILLGGDNFYEDGIKNLKDPKIKTAFETPYKGISDSIKFFACLGNHDIYNPNGRSAQFDYSTQSIENDKKFILPYHYYSFGKKGLFQIFVIDGNLDEMDPSLKREQSRETCRDIRECEDIWKILMIHQPLVSPGEHGCLEGSNERYVKNIIKNGIDLVCSGHDHLQACAKMKIGNRDVIQVVNGAGAKKYFDDPNDHIHPEYINNKRGYNLLHCNSELGYCQLDIQKKKLKIDYLNKNNKVLFTHKISK